MVDCVLMIACVTVIALTGGRAYLHSGQLNGYTLLSPLKPTPDTVRQFCVCGLPSLVLAVGGYFSNEWWAYLILHLLSLACECYLVKAFKPKKPLVFTNRIKRQTALLLALSGASVAVAFFFVGSVTAHALTLAFPFLLPVYVYASFMLLYPFERLNNARYAYNAGQKLKDCGCMVKIGITGSYGKTTVKNILVKLLEGTYSVLATEGNFNTPLGVAKTVKRIQPYTEVFIAEMGARRRGDVRRLCKIVKPDFGIITGVAPQHLETFKTVERVLKTKLELAKALPNDGCLVLGNCEKLQNYNDFVGKTVKLGAGSAVLAENVEVTSDGSAFTLSMYGEKAECQTVLLGEHNVENVLLAAALAYELGITVEQISERLKAVKPTPHRLQLINGESVTVIDDSYNANPKGAEEALKALSAFRGRKVVITPGIVELGSRQAEINYGFGKAIARVADLVMLIGKTNSAHIGAGLSAGGFIAENVLHFDSLAAAEKDFGLHLRAGDVVLFCNDLPDNYF